jgi:outer membrane protein assembly factor BamE (lipoprotein component of BamABCDE complex)
MFAAIVVFLVTVGAIVAAVVLIVVLSQIHFFPEESPPGEISEQNANRIRVGMTKDEVVAMLGNPQGRRDAKGRQETWEYQVIRRARDPKMIPMKLVFEQAEGGLATVALIDVALKG